ncbi:MAG: radical SAM protein, partial [Anaerolineae bacterium]|nr:radical SAM protein [Anaerolineae bacterium]
SECYQIDHFDTEVLVKANAIDLLRQELARKRVKGTIGLGSMNDPYMPLEKKVNLTGRALNAIAEFGFPVHVITKSDLVLRDLDTLREINRIYAAVSFTITTADDELGKKLEPGASLVSGRLKAIQLLAKNGIHTGITMMPILPYIEDTEENITAIVQQAHAHGAAYIIPSFGVTLRDRQRAYYYQKLDQLFPAVRQHYQRRYGNQYHCPALNVEFLAGVFYELCDHYSIATRLTPYIPPPTTQMRLF